MHFYLVSADNIHTEPLEDNLKLVDVIDRTQGAPYSGGVCEVFPGDPVGFEYDDDAGICYMVEGEIALAEGGETHTFRPGDVAYIPQKRGLVVEFSTETYGKFFYVTYPHWR